MQDPEVAEGVQLISASQAAERRLDEGRPAPVPDLPAETTGAASLMVVIRQLARLPEFDLEKLRELRAIHKEWEAEQNEKAFFDALARAQANMPVVEKNKHVYFESRKEGGDATDYWHADYGALVETIKPFLSAEGLSFGHKVIQEDGKITVHCVLRGYGHHEKVTMNGPPDDTGGKNKLQQIKSTRTYLKRATFEDVTGAATKDDDDDGRGASAAPSAPITASQLATLNAAIKEVEADRGGLIKWLNQTLKIEIEDLDELPADGYGRAIQALETKRGRRAEQQGSATADEPAAEAQQ